MRLICTFTLRPYLVTQWAAVRTHWLLMMEPPHRCLCRDSLACKLTCHGHSPGEESVPPTILIVLAECCIHTTEIIQNWAKTQLAFTKEKWRWDYCWSLNGNHLLRKRWHTINFWYIVIYDSKAYWNQIHSAALVFTIWRPDWPHFSRTLELYKITHWDSATILKKYDLASYTEIKEALSIFHKRSFTYQYWPFFCIILVSIQRYFLVHALFSLEIHLRTFLGDTHTFWQLINANI